MAKEKYIREGVKLVTTGSVRIMLGGLVAAVIPPQVNVIYKAAAWIGGVVISTFVGDKLDQYIDEQIDQAKECINTVNEIVTNAFEEKESGG